jgi:hypothetical protein
MVIKKCECGSMEFYVREDYAYKAELDIEGELTCGKADGGISEICCAKCSKQFSEEDFSQINF